MSKLHGIVIADPAKTNMRFSRIENDHYDVTRKLPGKPQGRFVSEQDKLNNFERMMPSVKGYYTIKERTVPMTSTQNKSMIDMWRSRRVNLKADVEIPLLEADKNLVNATINGGVWFNPKGVYPAQTFKRELRPTYRNIRSSLSKMVDPNDYAKEMHYLYVKGDRSFRKCYNENSSWRDAKTGRVHLFERPFTRTFS